MTDRTEFDGDPMSTHPTTVTTDENVHVSNNF